MNEQNNQTQPPIAQARNIFEGINQNIVEMSKDNVITNQLVQGIAAKVDAISAKVEAIYAALYQPMPERPADEIPEGSPNGPGEGEGSENE